MFMHVTSHNAHSPARGGWYIFYEAETMHAHSYTHVIHAWCFNDLLFLPSAGRRHQPSAVISGSSGPEPGPNTCIAHAPIAHHACMPACLHSCMHTPRIVCPISPKKSGSSKCKRRKGWSLHAWTLFVFFHAYVVLAFSCLPFRPIQGVEKPKDLQQPEPSQPSRSSRPPEPKYPPRPSAKQAKRTPPAPPKPPVLPKPWWSPPPPPAVKPIVGAKAPAAKSTPMDLGSVPKFIHPEEIWAEDVQMSSCFGLKSCMFVHACMTMFIFEDIYVASQLHSDLCWGCWT